MINLNNQQEKAQEYLNKHNIEEIIADMLNSLVHTKVPDPKLFMIRYLGSITDKETLEQNGIQIPVSKNFPSQLLNLQYPQFLKQTNKSFHKNIFVQNFTQALFNKLKCCITPKYNSTLKSILQAAEENQKNKMGLFLNCDEDYDTFYDNQLNFDFSMQVNSNFPDIKKWKVNREISNIQWFSFIFFHNSKATLIIIQYQIV